MKLNTVLCLLLLATNTQAKFWNKNGNKNEDKRRRLTEVPASNVDVDAATGTVKKAVSEEQEQAKKAAQTCDGQMALSLANANEAKINALAERDEVLNQKAQALEQVAALEKSLSEMEETNRQWEAKMEDVVREKDAKIDSIMNSLKSSTGEIVTEYEMKISNLAKEQANEVATLNSQIESFKESSDTKVQELENKLAENAKAAENTIAENAKAAEDALAAALKEMEDKHAQELAKLKEEMAANEKKAADALAKQEKDAKATLKKKLGAKDEKIKAAVAQAKKAEKDAKDSEEELAMWRATHETRGYCNYTYMGEDMYWAGEAAYNKSAALSWTAYEGASSLASKASTKTYDYTKPHYDKHVKPNYDKHVNPLVVKGYEAYETQVLPKLEEIKSKIDPKIVQLQGAYKKQFNKLARKYGTACDKAYKSSTNLARKNNLKAFDTYLFPAWKNSCKHPKDTLKGAQMAVAVALLLPYTLSILRLVLWLVFLPLRIIIAITPLRFFFYSSKSKKTPAKKSGDVSVKPKKTRINTSQ